MKLKRLSHRLTALCTLVVAISFSPHDSNAAPPLVRLVDLPQNARAHDVVATDLNRDGWTDYAVAVNYVADGQEPEPLESPCLDGVAGYDSDASAEVLVYLGRPGLPPCLHGAIRPSLNTEFFREHAFNSLAVADLDGDSQDDLLFLTDRALYTYVIRNQGQVLRHVNGGPGRIPPTSSTSDPNRLFRVAFRRDLELNIDIAYEQPLGITLLHLNENASLTSGAPAPDGVVDVVLTLQGSIVGIYGDGYGHFIRESPGFFGGQPLGREVRVPLLRNRLELLNGPAATRALATKLNGDATTDLAIVLRTTDDEHSCITLITVEDGRFVLDGVRLARPEGGHFLRMPLLASAALLASDVDGDGATDLVWGRYNRWEIYQGSGQNGGEGPAGFRPALELTPPAIDSADDILHIGVTSQGSLSFLVADGGTLKQWSGSFADGEWPAPVETTLLSGLLIPRMTSSITEIRGRNATNVRALFLAGPYREHPERRSFFTFQRY